MKKMIMMVAVVAASLVAGAEDYKFVSPIKLELQQFNLQELREKAVSDEEYKASLLSLQKQLEEEKKDIDKAQNSFKQEKKLYNAQEDLYKMRKSQVAKMKKNLEEDIKDYENIEKALKKQHGYIEEIDDNTCDAIRGHSAVLDEIRRNCQEEKQKCRDIQKEINETNDKELANIYTRLNDFLIELTDKENRLKSLSEQNKTNLEVVKAAIKDLEKSGKAKS